MSLANRVEETTHLPSRDWPIMLSTPRSGTSTLGAVTDPHPSTPVSPARRGISAWLIAAVLILVVGGAGVGVAHYLGFIGKPVVYAVTPHSGFAIERCREAVKVQLKAPATAKFGDEKFVAHTPTAGLVTGWVDAENGFGALVRERFTCSAYLGDTAWYVQGVEFADW